MDFLEGDTVRVRNDISYTLNKLGGGEEMTQMAGGIYVILKITSKAIRLNGRQYGRWWFKRKDLKKAMTDQEFNKKIKQRPIVMFDPANL